MKNDFINRTMDSLKIVAGVLLCLAVPLVLDISGCWVIMNLLGPELGILVALPYVVTVGWVTFVITETVTRHMNAGDINSDLKQHDEED